LSSQIIPSSVIHHNSSKTFKKKRNNNKIHKTNFSIQNNFFKTSLKREKYQIDKAKKLKNIKIGKIMKMNSLVSLRINCRRSQRN
jgi:hypothetical protein